MRRLMGSSDMIPFRLGATRTRLVVLAVVGALAVLPAMTGTVYGKGPVSGPGKAAVGVDASTWTSDLPQDPDQGLFAIGGSGQLNGEFTTAERYGIQIGLRAQERFAGPLEATPSQNGKMGIYQAETGFSTGTRATWNYDWHVDLRNAQGVAAGTTLDDYDLTLETNMFSSLFGSTVPADLTFGFTDPSFVAPNAVLFQESFNPDFGNDEFNPQVEDTYRLSLVLTPESFNGPPLKVAIQVVVTDQT
jgi:hypothetical protein